MIALVGTCTFSTLAPRTELYIRLACADLRPEYDTLPVFLPWPQLPHGDNSSHAFSSLYTQRASVAGGPHHHPIVDLTYHPSSAPSAPPSGDGDMNGLPGPNARCNTDPAVQAAVARLSAGVSPIHPLNIRQG